ncbi:MAG TPA: PAS domain S-box protein [Burkholderiales bacterium]
MPKAKPIERARREEGAASPLDAAFKLVDSLPVPVFFKSRDGRYLGVNRAWEEFFGIPADAFIGKQVAELYPQDPEVAEKHAAMDRELYARPGRQSYEITVPLRDGQRRDTIYYKATYTDARGEVAGLIGTIVDITGHRRAEAALHESEARLRGIVDALNEGILAYDRDLKIVWGNQAAERIVGLPLAELMGAEGFTSVLPSVKADGTPLKAEERPIRITVRTGKPLSGHVVGIKRAGGAHTWISVNTGFLRHADSSDWYGLVATFTDITAQRNAEQALRESEMRFRETFELAASGIAHVDLSGRFLRVNRSLCEILGYTQAELIARSVKEISHPEDRDLTDAERGRVRRGEIPFARFEKRYVRSDGSTVWVELSVALARNAQGAPLYEIAIFDDITERKQAEAALRDSEERFRRTFELAGSGVSHVSLERRFLRVNRRLCEMLGYREDELVGMSVKEISHPDDRDATDTPRVELLAGSKDIVRLEKRYLRKDGTVVWANISLALQRDGEGRPQYVISVVDDITARRQAEAALRESEERYRRTFELAGSGVAHIGLDRRFIRVNRKLCEILGYPEHELTGMTGRQISHPDDLDVINTQRPRLYRGEIDNVHVEKRYVRKDGSTVWVAFSMVLERDAQGEPLYEIAIFDDITERKESERALRESEERFRSLTQLSSDWYWEQDENFGLTFMSGRMGQRTGLAPSDYLGRKRWETPALNLTEADWQRHRAQLERHEPFRDFEMLRPSPDGTGRWVCVSGEPIFDERGRFKGYRGVGQDITERKRAEEELRRAHDELARKAEELQRSNAELEQFAYVASHDLQEPLRMVSSYTQLLGRRYGERLDGDAKEFMHYIVDGAARMKQLIEDLLAYSRVGTKGKEFKPVEIEAPLRKAIGNLRAAIEESGAAVTWDPLPTLSVDELQLAQLFQNLIGNAPKFRGQGVPRVHVSALDKDDEYEVTVADNGIGIDPQYFERIFMVFQRLHTMGDYPGTGIGLAICKKVVERHGGAIWVTSTPGEGSQFHFTLPKKRETQ